VCVRFKDQWRHNHCQNNEIVKFVSVYKCPKINIEVIKKLCGLKFFERVARTFVSACPQEVILNSQ
jgi:hypothetical protein